MKCPCKNCADRTTAPNCHMHCERYLAYQAQRVKISERRHAEREITDALVTGAQKIKQQVFRKSGK